MDLEGLIGKFSGELSDDQVPPPDSLLEYAQQIQNFFSEKLDTSKLDYYFGLAFPDSKMEGLLGFLGRKITQRQYDKAKEAVLNLIQFVIVQQSWKSEADRFYLGFKEVADMYWKNSKETARLQQAALDCLISLFNTRESTVDLESDEFDTKKLYLDLLQRSEKSSFQPTVRGKMFHLMGILGYLGHASFMQQSGWFVQLFKHITSTVKSQVESGDSHLEVSILHGCVKGLDKLLVVFKDKVNVADDIWLKFQEHLQQMVDPTLSIVKEGGKNIIKRREFQRAALEIVANHGELIQAGLFKMYKQWFEDLIQWSKSPNADDNRIGRRAMYKFLEMIIVKYPSFLKSTGDERHVQELDSFYKYFSEKFKSVLNTTNANKIELSVAVRGFGMLSNLCTNRKQALEMLSLIMVHVDSIIHELDSPVVDKYSGSISVLPTYLESVASILPSLKTEDSSIGIPPQHLESIKKLTVLLIRFYPDMSENQRHYVHIPVQKLFISLWNNHHTVCEAFIEQVYQQSLLHIVSCPTKAEIDILMESWNRSHPESKKSALSQLGLKPVKSYMKFWKELLRQGQADPQTLQFDLMMQWILATIGKLDFSITFEDSTASEILDPVQGATAVVVKDFQIFVNIVDFYQELMSGEKSSQQKFKKWIVLFSYEILGYIKTNVFVSGFYKILAVVFDAVRNLGYFEEDTLEVRNLQEKLNLFFQGLGTKIQEFRDDLLFSVLELWLSLPDSLILKNFTALNQTLKTVFITGKSSYPLAIKGVEAVERWCLQKDFPVEQITVIMNTIFPILKTYFMTSENEMGLNTVENKSKTGNLKNLIKKNVQASKKVDDVTIKAIQFKILNLLGSFGQFIQLEEKENLGLTKDQRFLHYAVPFQDCKPEIYIDDLLTRVLELCEDAVERQTRISACEFLHTICLIFIGKSRDYKEVLFRRIFRSVVKLGCDSDIVVRQLFNPLCLQIIHWFSKRQSPYGLALIDVLMESLTQNEDPNRREFAALCYGEYFLWASKHQDASNAKDKTRGVLKSIIAMSTHASPNYRQGSVMAFNSIYRDFREDANLTSEFSFNLLFSFLANLKLSKELPEDCLLVTSTKQAIKHLERIFTKYKDRFNTALRRNFKPVVSETPCLRDILNWLIAEGGSEAKVYREECLRLVEVLCPLTRGIVTVEHFLETIKETNGVDGWIQIAEGSASREISDCEAALLSFLDASSSVYEFLYKHGLLSRSIFHTKSRSTFCSKLVRLCTTTQPYSSESIESSCEEEKMQLLHIFSKLRFAWEVLDDESLKILWTYSLELSKSMTSFESLDVMSRLVNVWCSGNLSASAKLQCFNLFNFEPVDEVNTISDDQLIIHLKESVWHRDMAESGLTSRIISEEYLQHLRTKLWNSVSNALFKRCTPSPGSGLSWEANNLSQNRIKLVENYLVIALCINIDESIIVDAAFDASNVSYKDGSFQLIETKGNIFQKQLLSALVHCKKLLKFDDLLKERPIKAVGDFIQRLLNLTKSNRLLRKQFGPSIFTKALANWKMISINCDVATTVKIFVGMLAVNLEACRKSDELSTWWSGPTLMRARHLDLKQKAEVFGYVTVFATSRNKKTVESIMEAITYLVDTLRPEEKWGEVEQYVTHIFRKILKVFEQLPNNLEIVSPILWIIAKVAQWVENTTEHALFRMARESVEKVVKTLCESDTNRSGDLVSHIYELINSGDNKSKPLIESDPVWKSVLLPAVSSLNMSATKSFFKKYIYHIIKKMEKVSNNIYEWKAKTISVHLLELLVYQTTADFVKGEELSNAYLCKATGEEVVEKTKNGKATVVYKSILNVCANGIVKSDDIPRDDAILRKCIFTCYEACYNTLVATLIVSKAEHKFFQGFVFCGKKLYEKIIDDDPVYEFPVFIDEESHKLGVVSSRKSVKSSNMPQTDVSMNLLPASGNLTGSSLAPEATSYDFTTSVTVANSDFYKQIFASDKEGPQQKSDSQTVSATLEWNEVNKHECMFAYVETLKEMNEFHRNKQGNTKWIDELVKILKNPSIHNNVKTFLVGGIINTPESVEPFAADLVEPIIKLVLRDCFGRIRLNHFVQDVIITLLSWIKTPGARPSDELVTSILNYIVDGVRNEEISKRRDVLNHVMEILQNVIRYWCPEQENVSLIPSTEIYALGPADNPTDESSILRLQVCLSVLAGGQLPLSNVSQLIKFLSKSTTSRFKGVRVTAAKCIGRLLSKTEEAKESLDEHLNTVCRRLENNFKTKPSNFVENLAAIQSFFPPIMTITQIRNEIMELFKFPKLRSDLLSLLPLLLKQIWTEKSSQHLHTSPSSPNCMDEFFTDIDGRGLFQHSVKTNSDLSVALELFTMLVDNCAQPTRILKMVDWLLSAERSDSIKIKSQFAECLAKLYDRLLTEAAQTNVPIDPKTKQSFLRTFVRMYEDDREELHEVVNLFWTNVLRDWGQSSDLLLELLDLIGQEDHPLNVYLGLILRRCSLAPDHSKHIFQDPLENCEFYPLQLDTSWRLRHSTFQPLFAESLSSVKNFGTLPRAIQSSLMSQRRSVGKFGMNVLRATLANLRFTPTQQNVPGDSMEGFRMEVDQDSVRFENSNDRSSTGFNNSQNQEEVDSSPSSSIGNAILKLRKKFYAQKDSAFYATRGSEIRSVRIEEARDLQRSRVSGVKTVRSYRIGELPDILIRHSDVLNTLLKLARQDENFGRQFLLLLFQGMVEEMQNDHRKSKKFLSKAKDIFDRVFRNILPSPDRSLSTLLLELSITNSLSIPTSIVLNVCKICNLQTLGILKLEQELTDEVDPNQSSKRSRQAFQTEKGENSWLGLAELYKEIEEYDILRNIFVNVEHSTTNDLRKAMYTNVGNALHWQGLGHLEKAMQLYDDVLDDISEEEITATAKIFLEDSLMNCVAELGNWESLYELTTRFSPLAEEGIQNHEHVKRFIPVQMLSGLQLMLRNEDEDVEGNLPKFHAFVENNLSTEEGTHFLTTVYPFDVAVWLLIEKDEELFPQAKLIVERGNEDIMKQLKSIDSLPLKAQKTIILSLQQSAIIQDYCVWKKHGQKMSVQESSTRRLLGKWNKVLTHQPLDLRGNNLVASFRDGFLAKIGVSLQEMCADEAFLMSIQQQRVDQEIWLANLGALHKSFAVSQSCLSRLESSGREDIRRIEFRKSLATSLAVFAQMFEPEQWCERWRSIWMELEQMHEDADLSIIKVDLIQCLAESVKRGASEEPVYASVIQCLNGDSSSNLTSCLLSKAVSLMPTDNAPSHTSSVYNKLFCLMKKLTDIQPESVNNEIAETMLRCLLRGCTNQGNSNEMLLLSNMFPLLKQWPNLNQAFEQMISTVPLFLFLPWIDQIVTAYKSFPQEYACFKNLISGLVKAFPHAFQLQYPEYLLNGDSLFGKALKAVVLPFKMHEEMVGNILCEKSEEKRVSLLNEFQTTLQDIINNSNTFYGEYHSEFATEMFEIVNGTLSEYPKSSQSSDSIGSQNGPSSQSWNSAKSEILNVMKTHEDKIKRHNNGLISLELLSPFLYNFHFFDHATFEKPGLYENFKKPNVQEHPVIVSFHPMVQYYNSLTRPIRLTVVTNDGKRSNFLAKLGDDLRQDRRIQQLFRMSNVLFQKDVALKKKNLSLGTYSCIPITPDFGIIEMIDNVMSLVEVVFDSQDLKKKRVAMMHKYENWMKTKCSQEPRTVQSYDHYRITANNVGREEAEVFYSQLVDGFQKYTLRDNIKKRSSSLQEFFSVRQSLIKSYGSMCMVHWLLGIGDRHLENCLLSMSTGKLVGIDFGRAFGTCNYVIPIPEMIPFRLTPQLQQLMMPYTYKGAFRESCIQTWNCLMDASEVILTVANVFIQEPTVDWLKLRQGSKANHEKEKAPEAEMDTSTSDHHEYFPFEILKRKLSSHNPTHLIIEELKRHNRKDVSSVYCKIVQEGRELQEEAPLSSEDYVDVLLDLATDKNILSRIFSGWNAWI